MWRGTRAPDAPASPADTGHVRSLTDVLGLAEVLVTRVEEPDALLRDAAAGVRAVLEADELAVRPVLDDGGDAGEPVEPGPNRLVLPLHLDGERWGELLVARDASRRPFDAGDAELGRAVAGLLEAGLTRAAAWRHLQALAWSDALTGVANRRAFDDRLAAWLSGVDGRPGEEPLSVVIADVNGLKEINDRSGHHAGDDVLRMVAGHALGAVKDLPRGLAARLGGDEFALLLPGLGRRRALRVATAWCRRVADEVTGVSLACGVATSDAGWSDPPGVPGAVQVRAALVRAADEAAYRAKRIGSPDPVLAGRAG